MPAIPRQAVERGDRIGVGGALDLQAAEAVSAASCGTDAGIVEAGRYRVRLDDLALLSLGQVS